MPDISDMKVRVVYEDGVFKPLQQIELQEGTVALVVLKPGRITDAAKKVQDQSG
jgi:predicted DNA-binding antitoxin AbrB/MazE fold protein